MLVEDFYKADADAEADADANADTVFFFCSGAAEHYLSTISEHFLEFRAICERTKLSTFFKFW